jgi:hypothetical protein
MFHVQQTVIVCHTQQSATVQDVLPNFKNLAVGYGFLNIKEIQGKQAHFY